MQEVLAGRDPLSDRDAAHAWHRNANEPLREPNEPVVFKSMGAWAPSPGGHVHIEVRHRAFRQPPDQTPVGWADYAVDLDGVGARLREFTALVAAACQ